MRMSTQFTISVQMLILFAESDGQRLTSKELAEKAGCNPVMIRQLFGKMKRAGLLHVSAGKGHTYLSKDPAKITLWDVFSAVEGEAGPGLFVFHENGSDPNGLGGSFQTVLGRHLYDTIAAMREAMKQVTIWQLAEEIREESGRKARGEIKGSPE